MIGGNLGPALLLLDVQILPLAQAAYFIVLAAVLGACVGSFINNVAWRMVRGKTAFKGRSQCSKCEHTLGILDLVPVLSWLFLRGKCRYCKAKISPRYLIVEVLMAALFALAIWHWGLSVQTLAYLVLFAILCGVMLVDLETKTIPNGFIIAGLVVWVASVWFMPVTPGTIGVGSLFVAALGPGPLAVCADGLVGAIAIGGGILVFSLLFDKVTGKNSLGGGDIKLYFMVSLYLGLAAGLFNLLVSCVFGLVFAFVWALFQQGTSESTTVEAAATAPAAEATTAQAAGTEASAPEGPQESFKTKAFPFGPAIAAATVLTLFVGPAFLTWYVGLL